MGTYLRSMFTVYRCVNCDVWIDGAKSKPSERCVVRAYATVLQVGDSANNKTKQFATHACSETLVTTFDHLPLSVGSDC